MKSYNNESKILEKYAAGRCSKEEAWKVHKWFNDLHYRPVLYPALLTLWDKSGPIPKTNEEGYIELSPILDKIHHRINIAREKDRKRLLKRKQLRRILSAAAAILILPLLYMSILYMYESTNQAEQYEEIYAKSGSRVETVLPDGTKVWINSGSSIKYPHSFVRGNRNVEVIGEAYFDVREDPKAPFTVTADFVDIKALGTKFNVMALPDNNFVRTTLESGSISVEKKKNGNDARIVTILKPDQQAVIYKKTGTIDRYRVDTEKYTSWKDGKLIFRNDPLSVITQRLERWYNTDIELIGGEEFKNIPHTLTVRDESINQVLEYLSVASPISWKIVPARKKKDGMMSKQKYIITRK